MVYIDKVEVLQILQLNSGRTTFSACVANRLNCFSAAVDTKTSH